MMDQEQLRVVALEQAVRCAVAVLTTGELDSPEATVARAKAFYDFLAS